MEPVIDVLLDALKDTLVLLPFLFVTYLAMEAIEHRAAKRVEAAVTNAGAAGPVVGAVLGALPQCGFSAMAATLFSGGVVTAGTLVAVVLSTSDEMIPVFLAHQESLALMFAIMGAKLAIGLLVGLGVDSALRALGMPRTKQHIHDLCVRAACDCASIEEGKGGDGHDEHAHEGHAHEGHAHEGHAHDGHGHDGHDEHGHEGHDEHGHVHGHGWLDLARCALVHTVQVAAFILLVTFACGLVIEIVGQDAIGEFLSGAPAVAVLLSGLIGLIPNCGASVAITELFLQGTLELGAAMAGLLASGGVGLLVLWRTNANHKQNLAMTGFVYAVAVAIGLLIQLFGIII